MNPGLLFLALFLTGCAAPGLVSQHSGMVDDADVARADSSLPHQARLEGVPFFPQQENQCGPAALAGALSFTGVEITPDQLSAQIFTPALNGTLQYDLLGATRKYGRIPYVIAPHLQAVLAEIASGSPVIVLQNVGLIAPEWHYAVVVGYDRTRGTLLLQSGTVQQLELSFSRFERSWSSGKRWAFVAAKADHVPASATEPDYLQSVQPLESIDADAARMAYQAALKRWPGSLVATIGAGNMSYRQGRLEDAARFFSAATTQHPDAADAWNNLAQTRLELGDLEQAQQAIAQAIALGGPHEAIYRKTKESIDAHRSASASH